MMFLPEERIHLYFCAIWKIDLCVAEQLERLYIYELSTHTTQWVDKFDLYVWTSKEFFWPHNISVVECFVLTGVERMRPWRVSINMHYVFMECKTNSKLLYIRILTCGLSQRTLFAGMRFFEKFNRQFN